MSSCSSKCQAAASPTVLDLDHVLTNIVQCMATPAGVMAFLAALPASARSLPLAALHELLQDPRRHVLAHVQKPLDALWPLLRLDVITPAAISLARDARPVFPCASAGALAAARPRDLDAIEWLNQWCAKITHYKVGEADAFGLDPRLISVLGQCTNLTALDVGGAAAGHAILEAVTTPAHRVRSITGSCLRAESIALVARWLASGHADHLDFTYPTTDDEAGHETLVAMLLKSTVLSSLTLRYYVHGILGPVVAIAPLFRLLAQFLQQLNSPRLCSLSLNCSRTNIDRVLDGLSAFPALEELTLARGCLEETLPTVVLPSTLRRVTLTDLICTKAAWDGLAAGLCRIHALDELSIHSTRLLHTSFLQSIASSLPDWIRRGVTKIAFSDCDVNDGGDVALAAALQRTTSVFGVTIDIRDLRLSVQSHVALGDALTSCRGVFIVLPSIDFDAFETEAATRRITYHYDDRTDRLVLQSPAPSRADA
ncbi:hypothetical protein SPRG_03112 [Saprolegnia parasitica CBS 223.65]|uniref:F-box domain-containing protein n=1 Tax=Saprolegnia parasitica (strain CBS 223.65) TaxID=695850 RepID=A0A067CZE7_SAPPC|nr:hypothetical protein SPRG_03112 [Saprolegnia parasitica CBS 223.65]KDO31896.1 hypothetical protein SPRG_03112 [Saprolegnia parasitica CBS 223.65]|eukprot:XP_012197095.1 hypothetical protein SPRG_03112 [Saprolegnia parasitica CBS 223.65]